MQALRRPAASLLNGGAPIGVSSAWRTAAAGFASTGSGRLRMTVTSASEGSVTGNLWRP